MAEEVPPPPPFFRLMNFVSEEQLDEAKKNRGERVEDGTAQRDRPLFEILKDNKDKKDTEFNQRFKHRPPKALDEDESEFLDSMEMSRKEYEQQLADEEANQLRSFQVAVAVHSTILQELKETPVVPKVEELKPLRRKNPPANPLGGLIIKVRPQAKKAKTDESSSGNTSDTVKTTSNDDTNKSDRGAQSQSSSGNTSDTVKTTSNDDTNKSDRGAQSQSSSGNTSDTVKTTSNDDTNKSDRGARSQSSSGKPLDIVKTTSNGDTDKSGRGALGSLVSYSDESEEDVS